MKHLAQRLRTSLLAGCLLFSLGAGASETEHREHGAHEHGHGILNVVIDGSDLLIELDMPGVNVVGFEREPSSDEEHRAVEEALASLRRAEELFVAPEAAGCRSEEATAELTTMEHSEEEAHDEEEGEDEEEADHENEQEEAHSELHAEYHFRCGAPGELNRLEVRLFQKLKNLEEIDVQIVTATLQTATELHAGDILELSPE